MAEIWEVARALESPTALLLRSKNAQLRGGHPTKPSKSTKEQADKKQPEEPPTCNYCHRKGQFEASHWVKYPDWSPSWWQLKGKNRKRMMRKRKSVKEALLLHPLMMLQILVLV
jgi:hypothetical protein